LAFSPDGKTLASISTDYSPVTSASVRLWDVKTGKENAKFSLDGSSAGYLLAFTPDGKALVSSCGGNCIEVWDVKTDKRRLVIEPPLPRGAQGAILANGKTLVVTATDASAALYDLETGKELAVLVGHNSANVLAVSKDGKWLATGCKLGIWDLGKRKLLHLFDAQEDGVTALAFSPDGKLIASDGQDRILNLWQRTTSNREAKVQHLRRFGEARFLGFTPGGGPVVMAGDGICWWEVVSSRLRGTFERPDPKKYYEHRGAALSPDGKVLATVSTNTIVLWDLREKPKGP
jgi:WD40 repeat protein